jgi:regulator of PEP synthase PpsR (kinase-PPPase family)
MDSSRPIDVVSDSTGETAERVVRAALLQFPARKTRVRLHQRIRDRETARAVIETAAKDGGLLVFTIVSPELREFIHQLCYEKKVQAVDVIGSLLGKLSSFLDAEPLNTPSAMLPLSEEYFRRIEAVEFAVKNDDGKEPRNLKKADLILVGVSRTSKTPLSTYLANRGIKVANIPLVLGVSLPDELMEAPQDRVVGLMIGIDQLIEIRRARLRQLGMPADTNYGLREHVREELEYAHSIFTAHPAWPVIDVTGRAIEETAGIIVETLKQRGRVLY